MMLADFGADVIKIEPPGRGDMLRILSGMKGTVEGGEDYMWQMDGRNKRDIALDLKHPDGLSVLHKLAATCDVFITNMPYDSREQFKLSYEDLEPSNPRMIYASLTAYGEKGEERNRKGFDQLAYWARSGLMDLMREPNTRPTQGLPGMGDHPTAVSIYAGIVTALLQREKTGKGAFVQTSLLANGLWSCAAVAQGVMAGADTEQWRYTHDVPTYLGVVYETLDGRYLQFNMVRNQNLLDELLTALDAVEILADPRFANPLLMHQNSAKLKPILAKIVREKTSTEWMSIFEKMDLPVNLIGVIEELPNDSQVLANRIASKPEGDTTGLPLLVNHPIQVSSIDHAKFKKPPRIGEHSREILRELGYEQDTIDTVIASGAVIADD